ncbi:MAG: transcriptional regulator [Chloroflexota bacterium]|nr:MAG: transcriptional regulator [Chloroflexota bacterium]
MTNDELNDSANSEQFDRIVHEPARLKILAYLSVVRSADFVFLLNRTGLTYGNLSSHMSKLEEAGYIKVEKEIKDKRPHTMLSITDKGRSAFNSYRQHMFELLSQE